MARSLEVPRLVLVVNKNPPDFDERALAERVAQIYQCPVAAVLPHSDEMMKLASEGIFALRYPGHPLTARLRELAAQLVAP